MEAKVPQRIDMEDRLIGPLTFPQFLYLLFGGLAIYLVNSWTMGSAFRIFLFYPFALIVGTLSLALAFVKIQDRPFVFFLGALVKFMLRPRQRTWQRGKYTKTVKIVENAATPPPQERKPLDRTRLRDVTKVVDLPS